jgi:hypothetical protein
MDVQRPTPAPGSHALLGGEPFATIGAGVSMRLGRLLLSIALITALGCGFLDPPNGDRPSGGAGAGGRAPVEPFEPMRAPEPQSQPPFDAGARPDAAVGGRGGEGAVVEPMLPPNFTLECSGPGEAGDEAPSDLLAQWEAERAAHGALGHSASFGLQGAAYRVHGAGIADVHAPFTLQTGNVGSGLVTLADAEVEGVEERGRVELYAGGDPRGSMVASAGSIAELPLKTVVVEDGQLAGTIGVTHERVGNTDFYRASAEVADLALEDIQQAYLYPDGTTGLEERIAWMPSGAVVVREASGLTFHDAEAGAVQQAMEEPLDLDYEAFSVAGDFASGSIEVDDLEVRGTPVAVFGRAAKLRADAGSVEARSGFRLTQAVNEAGLVLPAAVEVVPEAAEVWVRPNQTRVVRLHYRERSYRGDAVLGEIQIGGRASDLLELQTGFPKTLTGEIIEAVIDTGWAAPLAAIAALPTVSIVFVIDVFDCIFGGCANLPPPLEPFPQWMDAGAIGTMEVRVKGNLVSGTYPTQLTFVGRNYCPVTVSLTVHIGEPPAPDAGADAGDAAAGEDGG